MTSPHEPGQGEAADAARLAPPDATVAPAADPHQAELLALAFRATGLGAFDVELPGGATRFDSHITALAGAAVRPAASFEDFLLRVHPDDAPAVRWLYQACVDGTCDDFQHEFRQRYDDGPWRWYLAVGHVVDHHPDGRGKRLLGTQLDITARHAAEEQRRRADRTARFERLLEQSPDVIWRLRLVPDFAFEYMSRGIESLTGDRPDAFYDDPELLFTRIHPDDRERRRAHLASGDPVQLCQPMVLRVLHRDGSVRWIQSRAVPEVDADGRIVAIEAIARDVTRERLLDDQLRHAQKMEALGQLTGGVAHDFNNLLSVVIANTAFLRDELGPIGGDIDGCLADIQVAAQRGAELVRRMMAFARSERLVREPLDVVPRLAELARTLRRVIPESIEIRLDVAPELPPIDADAGAVAQMIFNLATNARDAMAAGGRLTLEARVVDVVADEAGARPAGRYVVVAMLDTGHGMDAEVLDRVCEPFFTTKPVGEGTGLGLSMVHGLMQQHDGWLTIDSAPGVGTSVRLYFRVAGERRPAPTVTPEEVPGAGEGVILLVEDEPALRRVATRALEAYGYEVVSAADGEDAWALWLARGGEVRLVVCDAVLPRLSGPMLLARLREAGSRVPFLLTTGYSSELGGLPPDVPVLAKPWRPAELHAQVAATLAGRNRRATTRPASSASSR